MANVIEKTKKRKINGDKDSRPSKRVAFDTDSDRSIKLQHHKGDSWPPIIASAPGVILPSTITLKPYTKPRNKTPVPPSSAIASTELLLHSSEHPKLDYTAREEEFGVADVLRKHYVGVFDPATGKLEVMEARKMVVRASARAHQAELELEPETNLKDLRNALGQAFGTKKAKKAIASVKQNAISATKSSRTLPGGANPRQNASTAAVLASMAEATSTMLSRAELDAAVNEEAPRPKANKSAAEVEDVYTIESLIGQDIFSQVPVLPWQKAAREKKAVEVSSKFVASRIMRDADDVERLKILRYMLLLLELLTGSRKSQSGLRLPEKDELKAVTGGIPFQVVESIKRKFSKDGVISRFKQDLLITHLCALACIVDNFTVDMFDLQEDLRFDVKQMTKYFREIGARVLKFTEVEQKKLGLTKAEIAQRRMVKLKLPLELPKISRGRRI